MQVISIYGCKMPTLIYDFLQRHRIGRTKLLHQCFFLKNRLNLHFKYFTEDISTLLESVMRVQWLVYFYQGVGNLQWQHRSRIFCNRVWY
jgi:hypothetical protein